MRIIFRKSKTFVSLPRFQKLWFVPVWIILGIARALVLLIPFRWIASFLGKAHGIAAAVPLITPQQEMRARQIGQTIRLTSRFTPWDANCFAQAIAARFILKIYRVPYALFFGLSRKSSNVTVLQAHAWTLSGRIAVTGGDGFREFTVVAAYTG